MEREATTNLWETVVPLLRDQLTESVWFSTFNDAVNVGDENGILLEVSNTVAGERIVALPGNDRRRTNRTWSPRFRVCCPRATTDDAPVEIEHEMPTPASEHNRQRHPLPEMNLADSTLGMRLRHS